MPIPSDAEFSMRSVITEVGGTVVGDGLNLVDTHNSLKYLLSTYKSQSSGGLRSGFSGYTHNTPQYLFLSSTSFSKTYGDASFTFTVSSRTQNGIDSGVPINWTVAYTTPTSNDTGKVTVSQSGTTITATIAGATTSDVTITVSHPGGTDSGVIYSGASVTATVSVAKKSLTVTADASSKTYGGSNPTLTSSNITTSGFVNSETISSLTGQLEFAFVDASSNVVGTYSNAGGTYYVRPSGYTSNNYTISFVDGTYTIGKATPTISFGSTSLTYNGSAQSPTYTITGLNNDVITGTVSYLDSNGDPISQPTNAASSAGTSILTYNKVILVNTTNYSGTNNTNFTIARAAPTVTLTLPSQSVTVGGTQALLNTATLTNGGGGAITYSATTSYTYVTGTTIYFKRSASAGLVTVTATSAQTQNHLSAVGSSIYTSIATKSVTAVFANTSLTYNGLAQAATVSYSEFIGDETITSGFTSILYNGSSDAPTNYGTYTIASTATGTSFSGTTTSTNGMTIAQKAITITATAASKIYGQANSAISLAYTESGLLSMHSITGTNMSIDSAVIGTSSNVGSYSNAIQFGTIAITLTASPYTNVTSNYSVSTSKGTATVNKASLSVSSAVYTYTYAPSTNFTYSSSNLTITNSTTYEAASGYGAVTILYYVGGDYVVTAPTEKSTDASTDYWNLRVAIASSGNYNAYNANTADHTSKLAVTKANQTATATWSYFPTNGTAHIVGQYISYSISGYSTSVSNTSWSGYYPGREISTQDSANSRIYFVRYVDTTQSAGTLTINLASNNNYNSASPTSTAASVSISKKDVGSLLTVGSSSTTYDGIAKTISATSPYAETINGASYTATVSPTSVSRTNAGTDTLVAVVQSNDSFTGTKTGTLAISVASLSITANASSKIYGQSNPTLTSSNITTSGFVNSETVSNLSGTLEFTFTDDLEGKTVTTSTNAGVACSVYASGYSSSNYTITFYPGVFTINKASLSVSPAVKSYTYGENSNSFPYADASLTITNSTTGVAASGYGTITYQYDPAGDEISYSPTTPTTKFTTATTDYWNVKVTIASSTNYNSYSANHLSKLAVTRSSQSITVAWSNPAGQTFTVGEYISYVLSGQPSGASVGESWSSTYVGYNVSNHDNTNNIIYFTRYNSYASPGTLTVTLAENNNYSSYSVASSAPSCFINKKDVSSLLTVQSLTTKYTGTEKTITATSPYVESINFESLSATLSPTSTSGTEIGTYTLTAVVQDNPSFTGSKTGTLIIFEEGGE